MLYSVAQLAAGMDQRVIAVATLAPARITVALFVEGSPYPPIKPAPAGLFIASADRYSSHEAGLELIMHPTKLNSGVDHALNKTRAVP